MPIPATPQGGSGGAVYVPTTLKDSAHHSTDDAQKYSRSDPADQNPDEHSSDNERKRYPYGHGVLVSSPYGTRATQRAAATASGLCPAPAISQGRFARVVSAQRRPRTVPTNGQNSRVPLASPGARPRRPSCRLTAAQGSGTNCGWRDATGVPPPGHTALLARRRAGRCRTSSGAKLAGTTLCSSSVIVTHRARGSAHRGRPRVLLSVGVVPRFRLALIAVVVGVIGAMAWLVLSPSGTNPQDPCHRSNAGAVICRGTPGPLR